MFDCNYCNKEHKHDELFAAKISEGFIKLYCPEAHKDSVKGELDDIFKTEAVRKISYEVD
jgi:hypothetical protein